MNLMQQLLRGKGEHADPLACVDDLTAEQAGRRVAGFPHTVWQILFHLNFWIDIELKSAEDPATPVPSDWSVSWPKEPGPADEIAWRHEVGLFRTNLEQLVTLAGAQASTLARIAHPATGQTVEAVLWRLVAHNSYHTGQMVQLRQAIGAWPPREPDAGPGPGSHPA